MLAVTNAAGTNVREYIYNDSTLVGYVNAGILIYVHNDHLNTPQVITAQNQSVLWMADYEPFGKAKLNSNNTIAFGARFPGQYLDSETGLYYNYFRDYDPSIGRYIESDPIGLEGGINTYAYVLNNPLRYRDPYGLESEVANPADALIGLGMIFAALAGNQEARDAFSELGDAMANWWEEEWDDDEDEATPTDNVDESDCEKDCALKADAEILICNMTAGVDFGKNSKAYKTCTDRVNTRYVECMQDCAEEENCN